MIQRSWAGAMALVLTLSLPLVVRQGPASACEEPTLETQRSTLSTSRATRDACTNENESYTFGSFENGDIYTGNGNTTTSMDYGIPDDGQSYSGTYLMQITDSSGNLVSQQTGAISDAGNGGSGTIAIGSEINVPTGGSVSIRIDESGPSGGSLSAGYVVRNFHGG